MGWLLVAAVAVQARTTELSIGECRTLAIQNNKELRMAGEREQAACHRRKAAFTNYLPRISAAGAYLHTSDELSLLSDEQKNTLGRLGTNASGQLQGILQQYPSLGEQFGPVAGSLAGGLDAFGTSLVDGLRTDTRNMTVASVMLTQPVYMGGKIAAYDKITRFAEQIARSQHDQQLQEVILEVDRTYWQIVALQSKKRLAESYLELVRKLDGDVGQLIEAGMATKADGLSVKVKVNEANVAIIQVDNGLEILKMNLCRLCGLPLDTSLQLSDENYEETERPKAETAEPAGSWMNRPELSALGASVRICDEKVKVARAGFLPSVVLTGGYAASNPSVFNSFEKKFKGTWGVGVAVNIPILTWGDRGYKVKAARAEAAAARFGFEENKEKIELQVSQSRRRVTEAREKHTAALSSQAAADENLRHATLGLKEGVVPVSNVIEAQTAWLSAKTALITSGIDLRLAYVYLGKSLGTVK